MKLNKVMALALSGLMAVSMLAGCSSDPSNGDGGNTEVTPPASDAVSIMNEAQDHVKFESNSVMAGYLTEAAKKADHGQVKNYSNSYNLTYTNVVNNTDEVWKALDNKIDVANNSLNWAGYANARGQETTYNVLYAVANDGLTEKAALEQLAKGMTDARYPDIVNINGTYYEATYTGTVNVVTANTSNVGETASAYYILISVTQTVGRDAVNI